MARVQYVKDPRGPGLGLQILRSAGFRAYLCQCVSIVRLHY